MAMSTFSIKATIFRAVPSLVCIAIVIGFYFWYRDSRISGIELNRRAWEASYAERGLEMPSQGPKEGYWGARLGSKVPHPLFGWHEPRISIPNLVDIDARGFQHFMSRSALLTMHVQRDNHSNS